MTEFHEIYRDIHEAIRGHNCCNFVVAMHGLESKTDDERLCGHYEKITFSTPMKSYIPWSEPNRLIYSTYLTRTLEDLVFH